MAEVEEPQRLVDEFNNRREGLTITRDGLNVSIQIHADKIDGQEVQDED